MSTTFLFALTNQGSSSHPYPLQGLWAGDTVATSVVQQLPPNAGRSSWVSGSLRYGTWGLPSRWHSSHAGEGKGKSGGQRQQLGFQVALSVKMAMEPAEIRIWLYRSLKLLRWSANTLFSEPETPYNLGGATNFLT